MPGRGERVNRMTARLFKARMLFAMRALWGDRAPETGAQGFKTASTANYEAKAREILRVNREAERPAQLAAPAHKQSRTPIGPAATAHH